jgi:hypothetical protein
MRKRVGAGGSCGASGGPHRGPCGTQFALFAGSALVSVGASAAGCTCACHGRAYASGAGCPAAADVRANPCANAHDS